MNPSASRPLPDRLRLMVHLDPGATALTFGPQAYPWSYLADAVADLDRVLLNHPRARRIGVVLRNRPGPLAAVLAALAGGRAVITLSPHVGDEGLREDIETLRPDVVIAEADDWQRDSVSGAARNIGAVALLTSSVRAVRPAPVTWAPAPAALPADDLAILMMTSGTTGKPKRVALNYDQLTSAFTAGGTTLDAEPRLRRGVGILWSSLAHISGLYFAISHVLEGRPIALMERFDIPAWAELVREHRPGYLRLPPTAIRMVIDARLPRETFENVRAIGSGTAPVPPDLSDEFEKLYGVPILVKYGATEFAGAIAGWSLAEHRQWWSQKRGSVGRAHAGIELQIVDPGTGEVLPPGATGLLACRGPQLPTAEGQWLRTNDFASLDEDGFLFIHGRADDAINRGGFKIPPSVIEDALRAHPAITDSAAVGLPDARLGEVPAVGVTLCGQATEQELLDYLAARLTRYQMPVAVLVLDELPRTPSMKVNRPQLRDLMLATRN